MNYDDTVRLTMKMAEERGWYIVQDTAWEGYTKIPTWIMQGLRHPGRRSGRADAGHGHQAAHPRAAAGRGRGAGGRRARLSGGLLRGEEPAQYRGRAGSGRLHLPPGVAGGDGQRGGDMRTIMAGLACGEPNPLGWPVLRGCTTQFISCHDKVSALGMRVLGNPLAMIPHHLRRIRFGRHRRAGGGASPPGSRGADGSAGAR